VTRFEPPIEERTRAHNARPREDAPRLAPAAHERRATFSVHEPRAREIPVVVEVPHAGLDVDPTALATLMAPARAIGRDADLFVDELFAASPEAGAHLIVSHVSRYVCDLNRATSDVDARTVDGGSLTASPHGVVWRATTDGLPALTAPLPRRELERRMREIYHPYHDALLQLLRQKRERFGFVVLLSAHSMPSRGRAGTAEGAVPRADVVPGSRGRSTAATTVIELPADLALARGWTAAHDDPYRGGHTTALHGRPRDGFHAIQVELARRLYMDELTLTRKPGAFESVQEYCCTLVGRLGSLVLS
jgi:N-formylglutamate amidohydrolase